MASLGSGISSALLGFGFFARGFAGLTGAAAGFGSLTTSGAVTGAVGVVAVGGIGSAPTLSAGGWLGVASEPLRKSAGEIGSAASGSLFVSSKSFACGVWIDGDTEVDVSGGGQ